MASKPDPNSTDGDHFDDFAAAHPLWGMPYGMPAISEREEGALVGWVKSGAPDSKSSHQMAWRSPTQNS